MSTTKGNNKDDESIVEPREVDVLCGRGGMSNHHPGNEWYRRLIRSNRPLYRACPKHTKLLVSKAIVQAVEQQGGRFLDRNRSTGLWYPVPYKRAVDKTSQGLRERDRDEDPNQSNNDDELPEMNTVPDSFSGKTANPNLQDLAKVAIAHATRTSGLPPPPAPATHANFVNPNGTNMNNKRSNDIQLTNYMDNNHGKRPRLAGSEKNGDNSSFHQQQQSHQQQRLPGAAEEELAPLPTTLDQRQSSIYRFLKHTQLLPGADSWDNVGLSSPAPGFSMAPTPGNMYANNNKPNMQQQLQLARDRANAQSMQQQGGMLNGFNAPGQSMYGAAPQFGSAPSNLSLNPGMSSLMGAPTGGNAPGDAASANKFASNLPLPTLTRLQTQVSDWLNSFFPVATGMSQRPMEDALSRQSSRNLSLPPPSRQFAVEHTHAVANMIPKPIPHNQHHHQQQQQQALPNPMVGNVKKSNKSLLDDDDDDDDDDPRGGNNQKRQQQPRPQQQAHHRLPLPPVTRPTYTGGGILKAPPITTIPPPRPPKPVQITTIPPPTVGGGNNKRKNKSSIMPLAGFAANNVPANSHHGNNNNNNHNNNNNNNSMSAAAANPPPNNNSNNIGNPMEPNWVSLESLDGPSFGANGSFGRPSKSALIDSDDGNNQGKESSSVGQNSDYGGSGTYGNNSTTNATHPSATSDGSSTNDAYSGATPTIAAPTALEHSVSATLLSLATSPSKLFQGLSTFFDRGDASSTMQQQQQQQGRPPQQQPTNPMLQQQQAPPPPPQQQQPIRLRKSGKSLLDDDDEPEEVRRFREGT